MIDSPTVHKQFVSSNSCQFYAHCSQVLQDDLSHSKSFISSIHLTINQNGNCDAKALVHHWRVQYCEHEDDEHDNEVFLDIENNAEKDRSNRKAISANIFILFDRRLFLKCHVDMGTTQLLV